MKQTPEISIIVPTYNEEKYISSCLLSVFKQKTKRPYEVIVVDNNSQDNTRKIASKFDIKLVSEQHPGPSATRNTGAKIAKAKILFFLDADCRLPQKAIEKICQTFQIQPHLDVVAGPYIYDKDGKLPLFITKTLNYFSIHQRLIKLIFGVSQFSGGNFAIKKKLFWKIKGFNEKIANQEIVLPDDLDLAIRLHNSKITNILFHKKYCVYSSFRRVKKSPIKHTLIRFFVSTSMLLRYKLNTYP